MNKRFTFTRVLSLLVILLTVFTLFGCEPEVENTDQATVDAALANVALTYGVGDTALTVTKNLTLPTTVGTVTITWASGNTAVITNAGVVTRQAADTNVTLTATLTLGEATATKQFTLKVLAAPVVIDVAAAVEAIQIFFETGDTISAVTKDLILPVASRSLMITWTTTNPAVINTYGNVTRPAYGTSNETVIVTATIGEESKEFVVTVLAVTVKPVSLILEEARAGLLLAGIGSGVAANLTLPATAGSEGVTVTWTSNTPGSISNAGVVVRQPENVTVILTATLRYPNSTLTVTKDFEVVVLSFAPFTVVADIAAAIALDAGAYAKIPDVTVVGVSGDGYMIYDGVELLFVYTGGVPAASIVAGSVFTITGYVDYYFGSWQINGTKDANMPTILVASEGATPAVLTPRVITTSVSDYVATLAPFAGTSPYSKTNPFVYEYITLTTKVRVQDLTNYGTFLVNTNHDGSNINSDANSPYTTNALMIYYKSNILAFRGFDAVNVTVNVFLYSLRTDRTIYTVIFTGTAADIQILPLTDAESVDAAKTSIVASVPTQQVENGTIVLPVSLFGATVTWASSNEAVINPTTGAVTRVEGTQTSVTLTATITKGLATGTQAVVVKVGVVPLSTVAEVIALSVSPTLVRVTGVVTASEYQNTYFIQDSTGGIAVYTADATLEALLQGALGKEVEIIATRGVYNGLRQLTATSTIPMEVKVLATSTIPAAVSVDEVALNAVDMLPYQGKLITMTQLLVITRTVDSNNNVIVTFEQASSGKTIVMKWDSRVTLSTEAAAILAGVAVGDVFNITNPLAWNNNPYLYFTSSTLLTEATLTDANKLNVDANDLVVPTEVLVNSTLTLPLTGAQGSTIAWATSNDAVITAAGVVTLPSSGEVSVTLTATLTIGTTTKEATFVVVVKAPVLGTLMIYELYSAGGNSGAIFNRDYVVLYNGTGSAIDLAGYTLQYASATGLFSVKTTLTGTIAAGDYFLVTDTNAGAVGVNLPVAADFSVTAGLGFGASAGKVVLANNNTVVTAANSSNVVDFIGYGTTATMFEGTGPTPAPSTILSIKRVSFVDNNQNATDFVAQTPTLNYLS